MHPSSQEIDQQVSISRDQYGQRYRNFVCDQSCGGDCIFSSPIGPEPGTHSIPAIREAGPGSLHLSILCHISFSLLWFQVDPEQVEDLACVAREITKANGYGDRITIQQMSSQNLRVGSGQELERPADVLVAEIFDAGLLGEKAIATFDHAMRTGGSRRGWQRRLSKTENGAVIATGMPFKGRVSHPEYSEMLDQVSAETSGA